MRSKRLIREMALNWLNNSNGTVTPRDKAISEEVMAYDVIDLLEENKRLRKQLREAKEATVQRTTVYPGLMP